MDIDVTLILYIALLTLPFIIGSILLLYLLGRFGRRYRPVYREFLLRLLPGAFGGFFVYTLLRINDLKGSWLENIPSEAFLVMISLFTLVIGFIVFLYVHSIPET